MVEYEVVVVADDLTGAMDTGSRFANRGFETVVDTRTGEMQSADVLVIDTDTRYAAPDEAQKQVRSIVSNHASSIVYKKIDSTLRGNVVTETMAALRGVGADGAIVAPAFPNEGRITVGGQHLLAGRPVTETATGSDPDQEAPTAHLPTLFERTNAAVTAVEIDEVSSTPNLCTRITKELEAANQPVIAVCNAATDDHLASIADAAGGVDASLLYVGSAGLAGYIDPEPVAGGAIGVVGSANSCTLRQLDAIPDGRMVHIDPEEVINDSETAVDSAVGRLVKILADNRFAVVTAARSSSDVEATLTAGREAGLSDAVTRRRVADILGRVTKEVATRAAVRGLFITGGAVAWKTLNTLGVHSVSLTERTVTSGVPVGRLRGGALDGTAAVTKAGGFGGRRLIFNCLDHLSRRDE